MDPSDVLISESQERMLFIVKNGHETEISNAFAKYDLPYSIIGKVTDTRHVIVRHNDTVIADLPTDLIANAPLLNWPKTKPLYLNSVSNSKPDLPSNIKETILRILSLSLIHI